MIPLASPLAQYQAHAEVIDSAIRRVIASGCYVLGHEVESFERDFAAYCGVEHGIGVGSGTDAVALALGAFGIGVGDEVITVAHTALATVAAIVETGAKPVLVDVDPVCRTINAAKLPEALTARTRAVVPVHLYGQPADMDAIMPFARAHGLKVIEDCAQAAGARHRGHRVGSIGDAGCFSFYPTKNLGALGDGGMVVTSDAKLASHLRRQRQYGWDDRRLAQEAGVNSRLDAVQAAILAAKLPSLDAGNARRRAIAQRYTRGLNGLRLTLPAVRAECEHVFHLYVIECVSPSHLMKTLERQGIGSGIHYPVPAHRQAGYAARVAVPADGLAVTDHLASHILSLPIFPELEDGEVDCVVAAVRSCLAG